MIFDKNAIFLLVLFWFTACESEKRIPPKGYFPNKAESSVQLEAQYFWTSQNKLSSPYWKDANYVEVELSNGAINNSYSTEILNALGTYNGTSSFNKGNKPKMTLKAGYDDENLYILVEWKDTTTNANHFSWFFDGPKDKRTNDSIVGWSKQGNHDNILLLFDKSDGTNDVWKWSLAYTAPFDMAQNISLDKNGVFTEPDFVTTSENMLSSTNATPKYEWNDARQEITLPDGTVKLLDPAYYLLHSNKQEVLGNAEAGRTVFNSTADCRFCHGPNGNGISDGYTNGGPLNLPFISKYTRKGLQDYVQSSAHEGAGLQYFGRIKTKPEQIENLMSYLRGLGGIPGDILTPPSTEPAVKAYTNVAVGSITPKNSSYKILFVRKLSNDVAEDVHFDRSNTYTMSVRVSDNDEINYLRSNAIELIFKSNEL